MIINISIDKTFQRQPSLLDYFADPLTKDPTQLSCPQSKGQAPQKFETKKSLEIRFHSFDTFLSYSKCKFFIADLSFCKTPNCTRKDLRVIEGH